ARIKNGADRQFCDQHRCLARRGGRAAPESQTLTRGTLGTEPRGDGGPPLPLGPDGLRRGLRRLGFTSGIFSGLGVIGPSRYSNASFSAPVSSSLAAMPRSVPPVCTFPNRTSPASAFLMFS